MSTQTPTDLEQAIRQSGEGWVIDRLGPPSTAMNHLRQSLGEVDRGARSKFAEAAPDLSEAGLLAEYARNPLRVRGFFQVLGVYRTPDMLLMAWRIIQGATIKKVELLYLQRQSFGLQVVLGSPRGEDDELYHSTEIDDFRILGHLGVMKVGDFPVFAGFYPLMGKNAGVEVSMRRPGPPQ